MTEPERVQAPQKPPLVSAEVGGQLAAVGLAASGLPPAPARREGYCLEPGTL